MSTCSLACCLVLLQSLIVLTCGKHIYGVCVKKIHCSIVERLPCYPEHVYLWDGYVSHCVHLSLYIQCEGFFLFLSSIL